MEPENTTQHIEYDLSVLLEMTQKELTLQQVCRQDLFHPKRVHQLKADELQAAVLAKVKAVEEQLREQNLDHFADQVAEMIVAYQGSDE